MKLNKKVVIIAVLLGLISVILLNNYIKNIKAKTEEPINETEVVSAVNTIPAHVEITEDMLYTIKVPEEFVHPDAVLDKSQVIGGITNAEIAKGEQLLKSRVILDGAETSLSYRIPENMRAISIPANEISGVGGFITPGDKIDILVHYSNEEEKIVYTQLQSIEVIEVGPNTITDTEKDTEKVGVTTSLTLLVTPEQAEVIAFANTNGTFYFTLRNPMDDNQADLNQYGTTNFKTWRDR